MPIETSHLRLLTAIVEEGSVTGAARRLHLTQPALSHQLRNAEEGLGVRLFDRVNKKMRLTEAGQRLLGVSRTVLEELRRAEEEIRHASQADAGPLRLATECYTCYHWLPARLKQFQKRFPHVDVQIVIEATRQPLAALLDGRLDLAIVSRQQANPRAEFWPLFEDELVVVASPRHPLARRAWMRPEDFADEHLFLYSISPRQSTVMEEILRPAGVIPRKVSHVDLTEAILEMVRAGLGIAVFARWAVAPLVAAGELKALRLTRWGFRRSWQAATRRAGSRPAYVDAFVELLQQNPIPMDFARSRRARAASTGLLCSV